MITVVQAALYSAIDSIVDLGAEVYEQYAPQNDASYPYVLLTPMQTTDNSTDSEGEALNATFQVHVWSIDKSSIETNTIQKKIYDALHRTNNLNPTGYAVSTCYQESQLVELDPDGITRHGIQNFIIVFEPPITYTY